MLLVPELISSLIYTKRIVKWGPDVLFSGDNYTVNQIFIKAVNDNLYQLLDYKKVVASKGFINQIITENWKTWTMKILRIPRLELIIPRSEKYKIRKSGPCYKS